MISFSYTDNNDVAQNLVLPEQALTIDDFDFGYRDLSSIAFNLDGKGFPNKRTKLRLLFGSIQFCTRNEQRQLNDMFKIVGITKTLTIDADPNNIAFENGATELNYTGRFVGEIPRWTKTSIYSHVSFEFLEGT